MTRIGPPNSVVRNDRPPESSSHARDALAFAERIAAICSRVLGEIVASLIVHGSLALGDYTPRHSDIDLLGVVDRPLLDSEIELLTRAIAAERPDAPRPGRSPRRDAGGRGGGV